MNYTTLKTTLRQPKGTRSNNRLRKEGMVPGSCIRLDKTSIPFSVKKNELQALINKQGKTVVFKLAIDAKKPIFAMIRDIDIFPHTDNILNVSFFEVSLKEEIKTNVDFRIINEEQLLLSKLSVTVYLKTLSVVGLPNNIPDYIEIDAEKLKNGDNVYLKDMTLPKSVTTDADPETMVYAVTSFKSAPALQETEAEAADTI
jgi:large subunit ribosomal protein L25